MMMAYAIWKCRGNIVGLNRWLLVSWTIESILTSVPVILFIIQKEVTYNPVPLDYVSYLL